ncbi:uncharacterized protein [Amphiura filiformis]|uniref:uncharacterized protein n=1 Tax=Amphiura filiformis TaxID=82378 RepID=UPI003B2247C4
MCFEKSQNFMCNILTSLSIDGENPTTGPDVIPPVVSNCPSNIFRTVAPGTPSLQVTWVEPTATDETSTVNVFLTNRPGDSFTVGTTRVNYIFRDDANNQAICTFDIVITATTTSTTSSTLLTSIIPAITKSTTSSTILGCLSFEKTSNATIVPSKDLYNFGDSITVYCREGFELQGDETLVCLSSGHWHGEIPTCSLNMLKTTQAATTTAAAAPTTTTATTSTNGSMNTVIIVSTASVGGIVLLIILVVILVRYCKRSHASKSDAAPPVYYATHIPAIPDLRNQGMPDANNEEGNDNTGYLSIDPPNATAGSRDDYHGLYAVVE